MCVLIIALQWNEGLLLLKYGQMSNGPWCRVWTAAQLSLWNCHLNPADTTCLPSWRTSKNDISSVLLFKSQHLTFKLVPNGPLNLEGFGLWKTAWAEHKQKAVSSHFLLLFLHSWVNQTLVFKRGPFHFYFCCRTAAALTQQTNWQERVSMHSLNNNHEVTRAAFITL